MAGLTKDELKSALVSHGVDLPPPSAKKDELVALYEEHVASGGGAGRFDFSSDEEVEFPMELQVKKAAAKAKSSSSSSKVAVSGHTSNGSGEPEQLTEENSLNVGDLDVSAINDQDLAGCLKERGVDVGPIVDSTRSFYRKKLAIILREESGSLNGSVTVPDSAASNGTNGSNGHDNSLTDVAPAVEAARNAAEFSADDEDVSQPDTEDDQPSAVVRKVVTPKRSTSSKKDAAAKSSTSSSFYESKNLADSADRSLRQRYTGSTKVADVVAERFTPTPRRSIHSYKVTETTKQSIVKSKDGTVSHEFDYKKETTTSAQNQVAGRGRRLLSMVLRILPGIFMLLILISLAYYVYTNVDLKNRVFSSVSHVLGQASEMVYGVEEQQLPVEAEVEMPPIEEAAPTFADESAAEPAAGYDERT